MADSEKTGRGGGMALRILGAVATLAGALLYLTTLTPLALILVFGGLGLMLWAQIQAKRAAQSAQGDGD